MIARELFIGVSCFFDVISLPVSLPSSIMARSRVTGMCRFNTLTPSFTSKVT